MTIRQKAYKIIIGHVVLTVACAQVACPLLVYPSPLCGAPLQRSSFSLQIQDGAEPFRMCCF